MSNPFVIGPACVYREGTTPGRGFEGSARATDIYSSETYSPFFASVADGLKNRRTDPGVGQSAGTRSA